MISLTEESGPSQDICTESDLPRHLRGRIAIAMGFRFFDGFKKLEELDDNVKIWGFWKIGDESVAIDCGEVNRVAIGLD